MKKSKKEIPTPAVETKPAAIVVAPHNFTHNGAEVLILRRCDKSRISKNGFKYPEGVGAAVASPDWNSEPQCGNGLHGWPWGFGLGEGMDYDINDVWLVIGAKPADIVGELDNGLKCKFKEGVIRYDGNFAGALGFIRDGFHACIQAMAAMPADAVGGEVSKGDYSKHASSGYYSKHASSGDYS